MTRPDESQPEKNGDIADTQMFRRFVEEEQPKSGRVAPWMWIVAVVVFVVVAVLLGLLIS